VSSVVTSLDTTYDVVVSYTTSHPRPRRARRRTRRSETMSGIIMSETESESLSSNRFPAGVRSSERRQLPSVGCKEFIQSQHMSGTNVNSNAGIST